MSKFTMHRAAGGWNCGFEGDEGFYISDEDLPVVQQMLDEHTKKHGVNPIADPLLDPYSTVWRWVSRQLDSWRAQVRDAERADVLKYLRKDLPSYTGDGADQFVQVVADLADDIERGEHRR